MPVSLAVLNKYLLHALLSCVIHEASFSWLSHWQFLNYYKTEKSGVLLVIKEKAGKVFMMAK